MDQQGSLGRGHILGVPFPLAGTQPQLGGRRLILQVGTIAQGRAATPPTLIAIDTVIETPVPGPSVEIQSGAGALSLLIGESAAKARRPQLVPDGDAEAQHVLIPDPLLQGVAGRQGQAAPVKSPVVAELEAAALPLSLPVVAANAVEVEIPPLSHRLIDVELEAVALPLQPVQRLGLYRRHVVEVEIAFAGEAIGGQGEIGLGPLHLFAVGEAIALTGEGIGHVRAGGQPPRPGAGHIQGQGAVVRAHGHAPQQGAVILSGYGSAI